MRAIAPPRLLCESTEVNESLFEQVPVWLRRWSSRDQQACSVEALEPVNQHRPVLFIQDIATNLHLVVRRDANEVSIESGMVQRAECKAVTNRWQAERMGVWDDMCRIQQFVSAQSAYRAVMLVRTHHALTEFTLVKALLKHPGDISSSNLRLLRIEYVD